MACSIAVGSPTPFSPKLHISSSPSSSPSQSPFRPPRLQRRTSGLRASSSVVFSLITPALSSNSSSTNPSPSRSDDEPCCSTAGTAKDQPSQLKRKRPARLDMSSVDPAVNAACWATAAADNGRVNEVKDDGASFSVYSKRGRARARIEDRYLTPDEEVSSGNRGALLFGVFDGHGGSAAAEFVSKNIRTHLFSELPVTETTTTTTAEIAEAVKAGYLKTDAAVLSSVPTGGACAVTALITPDNRLIVSHAGDCRAVLCRGGEAEPLTADHRPSRPDEKERIESLGGYIDCHRGVWRVHGSLAVSRGFGDRHLKEWVTAEPETKVVDIDSSCQFLIMASDGLWDKVSDQEAVKLAGREGISPAVACKDLADLAVARGSVDDVTVMMVKLPGYDR